MIPKQSLNPTQCNSLNLKTSLCDWDSPSSFTGTVKRRPSNHCMRSNTKSPQKISLQSNPKPSSTKDTRINHILAQEIIPGNCRAITNGKPKENNLPHDLLSKRDESSSGSTRVKPTKLRLPRPIERHTLHQTISTKNIKLIPKSNILQSKVSVIHFSQKKKLQRENLKFEANGKGIQYSGVIQNISLTSVSNEISLMSTNASPPPYRNPPQPPPLPPTLPPANQVQGNFKSNNREDNKGIMKSTRNSNWLKGMQTERPTTLSTNMASHDNSIALGYESSYKLKSLNKERISQIQNCKTKINSKEVFSLSNCPVIDTKACGDTLKDKNDDSSTIANEYFLYNPFTSYNNKQDDDILARPEFTSSILKNLPVKQRKGGVPHLENYCLFDPSVDFINEKELKRPEGPSLTFPQEMFCQEVQTNEPITEVIYQDSIPYSEGNNNYFTIDPEDFEDEAIRYETQTMCNNERRLDRADVLSETLSKDKFLDFGKQNQSQTFSLSPFSTNSLRSMRSGFSIKNVDLKFRNRTIPMESNNSGVKYKTHLFRTLSTHSDADSGFLSPCSPDELKLNPAILALEQCDNIQGYCQIYTDWANYYLERARSKRKVTDLSADCRDGLLLADVIEAVTSFKVPDLVKKPKTQPQMYDNVNSCLTLLRNHSVGGLETVTANDICAGRLKAVLALFFALSRYKQQSKQQKGTSTTPNKGENPKSRPTSIHQTQTPILTGNDTMTNRQIPTSYSKVNGGTAIPLPATVLVQRRCTPDKVRPLPPTPTHSPSIPGLQKCGDINGSRPVSPPGNNNCITQIQKANSNGLRQPQCKISANSYTNNNTNNLQQNTQQIGNTNTGNTKHSMLDKLKLFNKDKTSSNNTTSSKSQISKRTSSSSGFSSARSERSDSSLSLNDGNISQIKPPAVSVTTAPRNKDSNVKGLKQSKLAATQKATSKEALNNKNSLRHEKKEKSPARKEYDTQIINDTAKLAQIKNQKNVSNTKIDTKPKPTSKIIVNKNDPKANSISYPKTLISSGTTTTTTTTTTTLTGIPKPMAAIKGTSKLPPVTIDKKSDNLFNLKTEKIECNNISDTIQEQKTHIINPISLLENGPANHISKHLQSYNTSMSDSLHSSSTHSGGLNSNSSDSSVIYRPNSESGSDIHYTNARLPSQILSSPQKNQITNNHKHDYQHETIATHKFNTVPSKIVGTIYEEEKPVNIIPMRPLLRGYSSHVTLPTRGQRTQHYANDFCESDINQGYCSDGDALRRIPQVARFTDVDNGYLSEGGGIGIHGKHFLSVMRTRSQLPTTIEERIRNSQGSLDSIDTTSPSSGSISKMEINGSPNRLISSRNIINRDNWSKMAEQYNSNGQIISPTSCRKEKSSPSHSRRNNGSSKQSSSSGRTKGVPQSFGYVKRTNGSSTGTITSTDQQNILTLGQQTSGRTAHVSAVQRSGKVKVSGGTQTCTADLQTKIPPNTQHRSFSLTGPGATQLSQSIRERLSTGSHSLPKTGTEIHHIFQHRQPNRNSGKILDGSLSDTQTYAEVKPEYSSYAMWLKHSNTASSRLSEGDSVENLQIGSSGITRHGHKLVHREPAYIQSPRLNRSNSIRSTKSEKMYPSMLNRATDVDIEPYYCLPVGTLPPGSNGNNMSVPWSQPTSPTPPNRGFSNPLSPTHIGQTNLSGCHRLTYPKKNDEVHGSAASLLSGGSSLYGSAEERQANEVRRLKRELTDAREQVMSLSSQLSTNAHVVSAFEQSLSNMTQRLQQLTATAERKDSELTDMRQTIELLRKQSIQAGLTTAHMQSMGVQVNCQSESIIRPLNQIQQQKQQIKQPTSNGTAILANNSHSNNNNNNNNNNNTLSNMQRHHSSDSMCSLNSISSGCSTQDKKKKKGWLRSSFTKAFSRNAKISKTNRHIGSTSSSLDQASGAQSSNETVSTLPPPSPTKSPQKILPIIENAKPVDAIELEGNPVVEDLKKQLREKDLVLTDIRLEALSSASQLESLKDTVMKMRAEMISLKQNNERLQKLVTSRSLAGSEISLGNAISPNGSIGESRRYSLADGLSRPPMDLPKSLEEEVEEENIPPAPAPEPPSLSPTTHIDLTPPPPAIEAPNPGHVTLSNVTDDIPDHTDGKKISIAVYLGQPESFPKYSEDILETENYFTNVKLLDEEDNHDNTFDTRNLKSYPDAALNEFIIAYTYISGKTTWQNLDYIVRKTFKDYVSKIDPGTNLGLNTDSITSYHLGEAKRGPEMGFPELLPCGYIVGNVKNLYICLQGVGSLAFDSLIPRSIVHRYISLLTEHRRLILCGPSGTGKSYLARKLAEFLVARSGRGNPSEAIATFNVDHKSSKELRQYLGHIAEQASMSNGASELPSVIILDNLHHASALGDVFSCLLSAGPAAKLPCIIGTMSQATCNTTNLQLHHNFRWVLTANHMEPVKGFLGRFLRRRQYSLELSTSIQHPELASVLTWLPTVWQHINRFLENHSSSDVTIGPRLFLLCPLDLKDSQVWFTDIWNYHLAPYLVEAVREGVQLYGRRGGAWNDPSTFIRDTYPWPYGPDSVPPLRQINAEDVGLDAGVPGNNDSQDPLLNMLMRLQEAANYSGNQDQESDCASLDSNITPDSSAGAE